MNVKHPYRNAEEMPKTKRVVNRWSRFLVRGMKFLGKVTPLFFLMALVTIFNTMVCATTSERREREDDLAKQHFLEWEQAAAVKQQRADIRMIEAERKEAEVNARVQHIEDLLTVTAMSKDGNAVAAEKIKQLHAKEK